MCGRLLFVAGLLYATIEIIYNYDALADLAEELKSNDSSAHDAPATCALRGSGRKCN